jgi:hypothetical protein
MEVLEVIRILFLASYVYLLHISEEENFCVFYKDDGRMLLSRSFGLLMFFSWSELIKYSQFI